MKLSICKYTAILPVIVVCFATPVYAALPAIELPPPNIMPVTAVELSPAAVVVLLPPNVQPVKAIELAAAVLKPAVPIELNPVVAAVAPYGKEEERFIPEIPQVRENQKVATPAVEVTLAPAAVKTKPSDRSENPADYNPAIY